MNNKVQIAEVAQTMSSLQIAELTGKRHDAILRDVRKLLKQGVNAHNFVAVDYIDTKGELRPCFNLTKKGCLILASGYNALLRESIINRWEELESQKQSFQVPQSFSEALMLAAHQQEIIEEQQREIAEQKQIVSAQGELIEAMKPKVSYCDVILQSQSTTNTTTIAQDYGMCSGKFNKLLHELGIQHKVGKVWVLYSKFIGKGYVQSITQPIEKSASGKCFTFSTWTQKGRLFLYEILKSNNILPLIEKGESA